MKIVGYPRVAILARDFGYVDECFKSFYLAEEELSFSFALGPVVEEPPRCGSDADIATVAPKLDALTYLVNEPILLDSILSPLGFELKLLPLLLGPRDGNEVSARPAIRHDLIGDPFFSEAEVPLGGRERRVDDWILNDSLRHLFRILACRCCRRSARRP